MINPPYLPARLYLIGQFPQQTVQRSRPCRLAPNPIFKTEGHPYEITPTLYASYKTLDCLTKQEILAISPYAPCDSGVDVDQRGISIMQLPFDTGVDRIRRWAGALAKSYRDRSIRQCFCC